MAEDIMAAAITDAAVGVTVGDFPDARRSRDADLMAAAEASTAVLRAADSVTAVAFMVGVAVSMAADSTAAASTMVGTGADAGSARIT